MTKRILKIVQKKAQDFWKKMHDKAENLQIFAEKFGLQLNYSYVLQR